MFNSSLVTVRSLVSKEEAKELFHRITNEGNQAKVFYDDTIRTPRDFVAQLGCVPIYLVEYGGELVLAFWLNPSDFPAPCSHFAIFDSKYKKYIIPIGKMCLKWVKDVLGYPTITGITPTDNTPALKFIGKIGMISVGTIPDVVFNRFKNETVSAVISYYQ